MYDPLGDALGDSESDVLSDAVADVLRDAECQSGRHSGRHSAGDLGRHLRPDLRPDPSCHILRHLDCQLLSDAPVQEELQSPDHEAYQAPIQALIQLPNDIPNQDLNQPADYSGFRSGPRRLLAATDRGRGIRKLSAERLRIVAMSHRDLNPESRSETAPTGSDSGSSGDVPLFLPCHLWMICEICAIGG